MPALHTTARLSGIELLARVTEVGRVGRLPSADELDAMAQSAAAIEDCSATALHTHLSAAICARHPHLALDTLRSTGLLLRVLPELDATVAFSAEAGRAHKDVWAHTKTVVWQSVPQPNVRWAALLHDIGKVPTRRFVPGGGVTFHRHAEVGEAMFRAGPAERIAFGPAQRERIAELIRWHLRPGQYGPQWSDSAVRRFVREVGPALHELLNLSRADITSRRPGQRKRCLRSISDLARRIRELQQADARAKLLPAGLGTELMRALELEPGPQIGELRARLRQMCEAGELEPNLAPSAYVEPARALLGITAAGRCKSRPA